MSEELGRETDRLKNCPKRSYLDGSFQWKKVSIKPASLDAPISDDDSTEFGEIVGD